MTDAPSARQPMRILIGGDTFAPDLNGSASFAKRLGAGLAARGHDVHVMAPAQPHAVGTFAGHHPAAKLQYQVHHKSACMAPMKIKANPFARWKLSGITHA